MFVYVITCSVNGKRYVGKSCMPATRWTQHKVDSRRDDTPLYRAMRKYGVESFEFEVVEQCESEEQSYERESAWIAKLGSTTRGHGYNQTTGGEGMKGILPETRERMSVAAKMRTYTPEEIARRGAAIRSNGKKAAKVATALEMYAAGASNKQIGAALGCAPSYANTLLVQNGIRRPKGQGVRPKRGPYKTSGLPYKKRASGS